ncbi:MAG: hypothetical protein OEW05_08660 [Candidatus Aminicenantes bacterium]|nr:hypothetical protein [Candidatus Aminicenantes bacterium]
MDGPRSLARPLAIMMAACAAAVLSLWLLGQPAEPPAATLAQAELLAAAVKPGSNVLFNVFKKTESERAFDLEVIWKDFKKTEWTVRYPVSKIDLAAGEAEFGYTDAELEAEFRQPVEEMQRESMAALRIFVQAEIARSRYGRYIHLVDKGTLAFDLNLTASPEDVREAVRKEFRRVTAAMAEEQARQVKDMDKKLERFKAEFLAGRGIRLKDGMMSVAYGACVSRNRPRVRSALEALRGAAPSIGLYDFLSLLLAFIQEIPFVDQPLTEGEKVTLGFWIPPRVLVENAGDCDSKGLALAAIWKNFKNSPLIVFKVPNHLFLGLAIPSPAAEGTVTVGGLRYTLCEVTGQELLPPGYISSYSLMYLENGRYSYERLD